MIAADGLLNLVPFEVVLGTRPITYVSSGRDLTHLGAWRGEPSPPVVVSGVDFGPVGPSGPWAPLPGAEREGAAVRERFPEARSLSGASATESAFRELTRPTFLHVATHGFFEANVDPGVFAPASVRGLEAVATTAEAPAEEAWTGVTASPALRSGIVLAGANRPAPGQGDGRLTAAELADLDLRSTRLAVLSACETGLGEVRNGEGVHGLRRALMLAGTHAQVLSLWKVDDEATEAWMAAFYEALAAGATASEATALARARVAAQAKWAHPFFWAAFTLSGNGRARL